MKIGLISDVHGNIVALKKCYNYLDKQKVDKVYFLGDVVGYLPHGYECFDYLKERNVTCLLGNHEQMLLGEIDVTSKSDLVYQMEQTKLSFSEESLTSIRKWPKKIELDINGLKVLLVHGSPFEETTGYLYPDSDLSLLGDLNYDYIFCGHTHRPFFKKIKNTTVVNIGAVGMPRDIGNLSSFTIFDAEKQSFDIIRIRMDEDEISSLIANQYVHHSIKSLFERQNDLYIGDIVD